MVMGNGQSTLAASTEPQQSRGGEWLSLEDEFDGLPRLADSLPADDATQYSDGLPRYENHVNSSAESKNNKAMWPTATEKDIKSERRSSPVQGAAHRELRGQQEELEGFATNIKPRKKTKRGLGAGRDIKLEHPSSSRGVDDEQDPTTSASIGGELATPAAGVQEGGDIGDSDELLSQQIQQETQAALASQASDATTPRHATTQNDVDDTPGSKRRRRRTKRRLSSNAAGEEMSQELPSPEITAESPALEAEVLATQNEVLSGDSHMVSRVSPSRKRRATATDGARIVSRKQRADPLDQHTEAAARGSMSGLQEADLDLRRGDIVHETQELAIQEPSPVITDDDNDDDDDGNLAVGQADPAVAGVADGYGYVDPLGIKGEGISVGRDSPCEARRDRRSRSRSRSLRDSRRSSEAPSESNSSSSREAQPKSERLWGEVDGTAAAYGVADEERLPIDEGSHAVVDRIVANILDRGDRGLRASSEIIYEAPGRRGTVRSATNKPKTRRQNHGGIANGDLNIMLVVSDIPAAPAKVEPLSDEQMLDSSPNEPSDDGLPAVYEAAETTDRGGQPRDLELSLAQDMHMDVDMDENVGDSVVMEDPLVEPPQPPPEAGDSHASSVPSSSSSDDGSDLDSDESSNFVPSDPAGNEDLFSNASDRVDSEVENSASDIEAGSREDQDQGELPVALSDPSSSSSSSDSEPELADPPPPPPNRVVKSILKNSSPFPPMLYRDISPRRTTAAVVEESDFEDMPTVGDSRPPQGAGDIVPESQQNGPVFDDSDIPAPRDGGPPPPASRSTRTPRKSAGQRVPKSPFFAMSDSEPDSHEDAGTKPPKTAAAVSAPAPTPAKQAGRAVAESPDNTPARNNRTAFSNLPSSQLAGSTTTAKRRGRPRKSLTGVDASQPGPSQTPSKSRVERKLSSQLRGETGRKEPAPEEPSSKPATRTGRFTEEELRRMSDAVEQFRDDCGMSQFEVNLLIHERPREDKSLHKDLWNRVLAACPGRNRTMAINRTRRLFHNYVARSTFTLEQDEELRQMVEKHGPKWAKIGQLINRHPVDIRLRWENHLLLGENLKKDFWEREDEARLIGIVMAALVRIQQSRGEGITLISLSAEKDLPWHDISLKMGDRAPQPCRLKWNALRQEASTFEVEGELAQFEPVDGNGTSSKPAPAGSILCRKMTVEDKHQLIRAIRETGVGMEQKIPWRKLVGKEYRRRWPPATRMLAWDRLKRTVPDFETKSVRRVSQYLLDQYDEHKRFQDAVEEEMDREAGDQHRDGDEDGDGSITQTPRQRPRVYRTPRRMYTSTPLTRNVNPTLSTQEDSKASEPQPQSGGDGIRRQLIDDEAEEGTSTSQEDDDGDVSSDESSSASEDEATGKQNEEGRRSSDGEATNTAPATNRHASIDLGMDGHPDRAQPNGELDALPSSFMPLDEPTFTRSGGLKRRAANPSDASSSVNADTFRDKRKRVSWRNESTPSRPPKRQRQKAKEVIHDETDSETERAKERQREQARIAAESDEDEDMDDIPARLPGEERGSESQDFESEDS